LGEQRFDFTAQIRVARAGVIQKGWTLAYGTLWSMSVFLFYSNLLMGEYERSGMGRQMGLAWAVVNQKRTVRRRL
jgi:hypothetical protein